MTQTNTCDICRYSLISLLRHSEPLTPSSCRSTHGITPKCWMLLLGHYPLQSYVVN